MGDNASSNNAGVETALRNALARFAVKRHVRETHAGPVWNGYSCELCKAECGPQQTLSHHATCLLAPTDTTPPSLDALCFELIEAVRSTDPLSKDLALGKAVTQIGMLKTKLALAIKERDDVVDAALKAAPAAPSASVRDAWQQPIAWRYRNDLGEITSEWIDGPPPEYVRDANTDERIAVSSMKIDLAYATPAPPSGSSLPPGESDPAVMQGCGGAGPTSAPAQAAGKRDPFRFFSQNVDAWGASEWFDRLAKAIRQQDAAVVAGHMMEMETCRNVAASSAMRLVRDYEMEVRAALTPTNRDALVEALDSIDDECVDHELGSNRDADLIIKRIAEIARAALSQEAPDAGAPPR